MRKQKAFILGLFILIGTIFVISEAEASCKSFPAVADWDGDNKPDLSLFNDGKWYIDGNVNNSWDDTVLDHLYSFGLSGDYTAVADWNNDGKIEMGVFRNGYWYTDYDANDAWSGATADRVSRFGLAGDIPVAVDWNNDGKVEMGVFREGYWYVDYNGNGKWDSAPADKIYHFGIDSDFPTAADWNNDGKIEVGVFRSGTWYVDLNGNNKWDVAPTDTIYKFGLSGDYPAVADWNNDGRVEMGVYRNGIWYIDLDGNNKWDGAPTDKILDSFINPCSANMGPEISVGLWGYAKSDIQSSPFQIDANKSYNIKDASGNIISQIPGGTTTKVTYDRDGNLKVFGSIADKYVSSAVNFDSADGDNSSIIFNVYRPNSSYDHYRGKIRTQYYHGTDIAGGNTGTTVQQVWIINSLPLEQYAWGNGETTGTGPIEHTKVMTTIFRTYGDWYIKYATKYADYGFKIRSDSGSQNYRGYDWEKAYPNIKTAAQATRSVVATYSKDVALTPYSSWSDGRTRSFQEVWGSTDYPWCKSVSDPYGKNSTMTTAQLQAAGNHMVGLIANGSLKLAKNYGWKYERIMKYYYTGISLGTLY